MKKLVVLLLLFPLKIIAQNFTNKVDVHIQSNQKFQALYLKCGNDISFSLAKSMNSDELTYKITGGKLLIEKNFDKIIIIPNSAKVTLDIFYRGKFIKQQIFGVQMIPKPKIRIRYFHKSLKSFPKKILIDVIADTDFKDQLPEDARYRVSDFSVTLVRNKEVIVSDLFTEEITPTEEAISHYTKMIQAEPNENWRLFVEVKRVQRMNFQNQVENVSVGIEIFNLPFELEN
ncbi:GldM family protein [Bernardetia sp. OM2101]|uniref:GldM family protein n=1 Tax=Bernardetia sp. OM2101 TaxID=3344876 RepID=UPI0035D0AFE3